MNFKAHVQNLHLLLQEEPEKAKDLLKSDYVLGNHLDILQVQGWIECLEDPLIFKSIFSESRECFQPLLNHVKEEIIHSGKVKNVAKMQGIFSEIITKKRFEEVLLGKIKNCLQKGQIDTFKNLVTHLVIKDAGSPCLELIRSCQLLKQHLERIKKFHEEGHQPQQGQVNPIDFQKDNEWLIPSAIAAQLDSSQCQFNLKSLIALLESEHYRADWHLLARQLATILAQKKDLIPLKYGTHVLPEELEDLSSSENDDQDVAKLHLWLERVAELLDNPLETRQYWIHLRQVLLQIMKLPDIPMQKELFNAVFDPLRIKAWSRIHFKQKDMTFEDFCQALFHQLFPSSHAQIDSRYQSQFYAMASLSFTDSNLMQPIDLDLSSDLSLSSRYSKCKLNYHELIFQAVDLKRDAGRFSTFQDELLKLHVIYKFLEDGCLIAPNDNTHSTRYRFMKKNTHFAQQILLKNGKQDENVDKVLALIHEEKLESNVNFIYQSDPDFITKQGLKLLRQVRPKKKFDWASPHLSRILKKLLTHTLSSCDREIKQVNLNAQDWSQFNRVLRKYVNFMPFDKVINGLKRHQDDLAKDWNLPPEILGQCLEQLEQLVHRPIPIKYAIISVCCRFEQAQLLSDFLNDKFGYLLFD